MNELLAYAKHLRERLSDWRLHDWHAEQAGLIEELAQRDDLDDLIDIVDDDTTAGARIRTSIRRAKRTPGYRARQTAAIPPKFRENYGRF